MMMLLAKQYFQSSPNNGRLAYTHPVSSVRKQANQMMSHQLWKTYIGEMDDTFEVAHLNRPNGMKYSRLWSKSKIIFFFF